MRELTAALLSAPLGAGIGARAPLPLLLLLLLLLLLCRLRCIADAMSRSERVWVINVS
jgi:hypothetical protein